MGVDGARFRFWLRALPLLVWLWFLNDRCRWQGRSLVGLHFVRSERRLGRQDRGVGVHRRLRVRPRA
jgi:hypothetical protein